MKDKLGWLTFVVSAAFAFFLFLAMARVAWFQNASVNGFIAFFGFGVPMLILGAATVSLWSSNRKLYNWFGWVCTIVGLIWAVSLLVLVAGWVGIMGSDSQETDFAKGFGLFLGFGVPMLFTGGTGIAILTEP